VVPSIAAWELWRGATTAARSEAIRRLLEAEGVEVEPFSPALARFAGDPDLRLRKAGLARPALDLLIASHALLRDAPLVTLDRDYDSIEGLDVVHVREEA
jgi:predicted nucleic acid-binding protein